MAFPQHDSLKRKDKCLIRFFASAAILHDTHELIVQAMSRPKYKQHFAFLKIKEIFFISMTVAATDATSTRAETLPTERRNSHYSLSQYFNN